MTTQKQSTGPSAGWAAFTFALAMTTLCVGFYIGTKAVSIVHIDKEVCTLVGKRFDGRMHGWQFVVDEGYTGYICKDTE